MAEGRKLGRADALVALGLISEKDATDPQKVQAAYDEHRGSGGQVAGPRQA